MKFITDLVQSLLKSILFFVIMSVFSLSLLQKKFPPNFGQLRDSYEKYSEMMSSMAKFNPQAQMEQIMAGKDNPQAQRDALEALAKMDPSMAEMITLAQKGVDGKTPTVSFNKKTKEEKIDITSPSVETRFLKLRVEQSEYKIKLLEYEVGVLKAELKKSRNPGTKAETASAAAPASVNVPTVTVSPPTSVQTNPITIKSTN